MLGDLIDWIKRQGFFVGWSWRFWGWSAMKIDPAFLDRIQDEVFNDSALSPVGDETFCNVAVDRVASRYGCAGLHDVMTQEPFTADVIYNVLKSSADFLIKPMGDCQELVNQGVLIVAALPSEKLGQRHGHVVTLTPGKGDYSGAWEAKVPLCMNVGALNFRAKGINWAFPVEKGPPEFYAWKDSL